MKVDESIIDQGLDDATEISCVAASGYTLETVARAVGDEILEPLFKFIQPNLAS